MMLSIEKIKAVAAAMKADKQKMKDIEAAVVEIPKTATATGKKPGKVGRFLAFVGQPSKDSCLPFEVKKKLLFMIEGVFALFWLAIFAVLYDFMAQNLGAMHLAVDAKGEMVEIRHKITMNGYELTMDHIRLMTIGLVACVFFNLYLLFQGLKLPDHVNLLFWIVLQLFSAASLGVVWILYAQQVGVITGSSLTCFSILVMRVFIVEMVVSMLVPIRAERMAIINKAVANRPQAQAPKACNGPCANCGGKCPVYKVGGPAIGLVVSSPHLANELAWMYGDGVKIFHAQEKGITEVRQDADLGTAAAVADVETPEKEKPDSVN